MASPGWSAADAATVGATLTNGGLTFNSPTAAAWNSVRNTNSITNGKKLYAEYSLGTIGGGSAYVMIGLGDANFTITNTNVGTKGNSAGVYASSSYVSGVFTLRYNISWAVTAGDTIAWAVDGSGASFGYAYIARNNVWVAGSNPALSNGSGAGSPMFSFSTVPIFVVICSSGPNIAVTLQSTQLSQKYAPPAGFAAWDGAGAVKGSAALMVGV